MAKKSGDRRCEKAVAVRSQFPVNSYQVHRQILLEGLFNSLPKQGLVCQLPPRQVLGATYNKWVGTASMLICTTHAEPVGTLIYEGDHQPFHALACPLQKGAPRVCPKSSHPKEYRPGQRRQG